MTLEKQAPDMTTFWRQLGLHLGLLGASPWMDNQDDWKTVEKQKKLKNTSIILWALQPFCSTNTGTIHTLPENAHHFFLQIVCGVLCVGGGVCYDIQMCDKRYIYCCFSYMYNCKFIVCVIVKMNLRTSNLPSRHPNHLPQWFPSLQLDRAVVFTVLSSQQLHLPLSLRAQLSQLWHPYRFKKYNTYWNFETMTNKKLKI